MKLRISYEMNGESVTKIATVEEIPDHLWGVCWKKEGRRKVEWEEDRSSVEGRRYLVMRREWRRVLPLIVTSFLSWNASGR